MARLVFERGSSRKFWEGRVDGSTLVVKFGRLGTRGQERTKKLDGPKAAKAALDTLIAEKKRKGYVPEATSDRKAAQTKISPPVRVPPARRNALIALATSLGGPSLAREVAHAVDDPAGYLRAYRARMASVGVSEPRPELGWLALTEGLEARKAAIEIDWKEESDSIHRRLRRLVDPPGKKALAAVGPDIDGSTEEALERYGKALFGAGHALVQLDKRSDSYKLMIVRPADVTGLRSLARTAGGGARWFRGDAKVLAALAKERRAAQARARREAALAESSNPWTRLVHSTWSKTTDGALWKLRLPPFPVEEVRAAMPHAPRRERPLIAMALALHDESASELARTTDDPALCLRALKYLGQERRHATERLIAAAVLAERLGIPPKGGEQALQVVEACNLFGDDARNERALRRVPAEKRRRLAEIAETVLSATDVWDTQHGALLALRAIGDERSIAVLQASRAKVGATDIVDAFIRHIQKRVKV